MVEDQFLLGPDLLSPRSLIWEPANVVSTCQPALNGPMSTPGSAIPAAPASTLRHRSTASQCSYATMQNYL
jgi:hypothetical protein